MEAHPATGIPATISALNAADRRHPRRSSRTAPRRRSSLPTFEWIGFVADNGVKKIALRVGVPRVLFESKNGEYDRTVPDRAWDASADGQRLLLVRNDQTTEKPVTTLYVVLNWTDELKRRVRN